MRDYLNDFNKRLEEIEKYFEFVAKVDAHTRNQVTFPNGEVYTIDSDLQRILRSNCCLLLYNLIESSIRNGLIGIYDAIHDEGLTYKDVSDKIQAIWLEHKCDSLTQPAIGRSTVVKTVQEVLDEVIRDTTIYFEKDKLPISGNLDVEQIEELIEQYGFYGTIRGEQSKIERVLSHIKKMRNDLAHGNVAFRDASRHTVMREMIEYKDVTITYLEDILRNIDDYIDKEQYRRVT